MSENKYCGSCKHFKDEDTEGWGWCAFNNTKTHCAQSWDCHNSTFNGWTEITPDNVEELYKTLDRVVIAHVIPDSIIKNVVAYEKPNELYRSLEIIATIGGYYFYVLPELKLED